MNYWLRLYTGILDDPKVQRLEAEHFRGWINLLCLAKEHDGLLPSIEDIAFRLRMTEVETNGLVEVLVMRGLIDQTNDGLAPHNWDARQFLSDDDPTAAIRARRYRNKTRDADRDVTRDDDRDETDKSRPPETESETETEQSQKQSRASRAKPRSAKRPTTCDSEFLAELQANPAYMAFDVTKLYHRMCAWCQNKGLQPTRSRLINWLNREDKPMGIGNGNHDAAKGGTQKTTDDYGIRDCRPL